MSYRDAVLNRATLANIREFLLYGTECPEKVDSKKQIEEAGQTMEDRLKAVLELDQLEEIRSLISTYNACTEQHYFELGLQCGKRLENFL